MRDQRGEANGRAVLTDAQIEEIRAKYPEYSQTELARKYGVTQSAISRIINKVRRA